MISESKTNVRIYNASQHIAFQLFGLLLLAIIFIEFTNYQIEHYINITSISLLASLMLSYASYKTIDTKRSRVIVKSLFFLSVIGITINNFFSVGMLSKYVNVFYSVLVGQIILFPFIIKRNIYAGNIGYGDANAIKMSAVKRKIPEDENGGEKSNVSYKRISIIIVMFLILILSFFLRVYNADSLSPGRDSLHHYIAAKSINDYGATVYTTLPYINHMLAFIFEHVSETLLFAKLPFIIAGTLSVLLIYFIGKKISVGVGIISALLFAICPWAIGLASYVRDYSFNLFYELLFITILLYFPKNIRKPKHLIQFILLNLIIYVPFIIFAFYQKGITIHIIIAMLVTTFVRLFADLGFMEKIKAMKMKEINLLAHALIIVLFVAIAAIVFLGFEHRLTFTFQPKWLFFFDSESRLPTLWYSFVQVPWYFILSLTLLPIIGKPKNKFVWMSFLIFYSYLIFFVFIARPNTASLYARYIYPALPFFTIMIAVSLWYVIVMASKFIRNRTMQKVSVLLVLVFLGTIFSFSNTMYAISGKDSWETDKRQVISDPYFDYSELLVFLRENGFSKDDVVILSEMRIKDTLAWHFDFDFYEGRYVTSFNGLVYDIADNSYVIDESNNQVVVKYDEGWIVRRDGDMFPSSISVRSRDRVEPTDELKALGVEIEYLGKYSEKYEVYRWYRNE
jgi:hypothetical protein